MPLEIPLLPPALLVLVFLAALLINLRPPEGYRLWLVMLLRSRSPTDPAPQFYNPFGEHPLRLTPARIRIKVPGSSRGWTQNNK